MVFLCSYIAHNDVPILAYNANWVTQCIRSKLIPLHIKAYFINKSWQNMLLMYNKLNIFNNKSTNHILFVYVADIYWKTYREQNETRMTNAPFRVHRIN